MDIPEEVVKSKNSSVYDTVYSAFSVINLKSENSKLSVMYKKVNNNEVYSDGIMKVERNKTNKLLSYSFYPLHGDIYKTNKTN